MKTIALLTIAAAGLALTAPARACPQCQANVQAQLATVGVVAAVPVCPQTGAAFALPANPCKTPRQARREARFARHAQRVGAQQLSVVGVQQQAGVVSAVPQQQNFQIVEEQAQGVGVTVQTPRTFVQVAPAPRYQVIQPQSQAEIVTAVPQDPAPAPEEEAPQVQVAPAPQAQQYVVPAPSIHRFEVVTPAPQVYTRQVFVQSAPAPVYMQTVPAFAALAVAQPVTTFATVGVAPTVFAAGTPAVVTGRRHLLGHRKHKTVTKSVDRF
ncbi:MAG TPA: hypothetical protein VG125_13630 [Pirellulales bacterium]|jgi:hypothetical protein|nr:hypothetical protein [Pirellulales bacterium]